MPLFRCIFFWRGGRALCLFLDVFILYIFSKSLALCLFLDVFIYFLIYTFF